MLFVPHTAAAASMQFCCVMVFSFSPFFFFPTVVKKVLFAMGGEPVFSGVVCFFLF